MREWYSGSTSPCQGEDRGFESRLSLLKKEDTPRGGFFFSRALPRPEGLSDEDFPAWLAAERERIARERHETQTILSTRESACWRRFAVNACLRRARTAQREALHALQQQELALNAHERAHRAAQVQQRLDEKAAAAKNKEAK